jgi:hypothetical protein
MQKITSRQLLPSLPQLLGFFFLILNFEKDISNHHYPLITSKLITETSEKGTSFCSKMLYNVNIRM